MLNCLRYTMLWRWVTLFCQMGLWNALQCPHDSSTKFIWLKKQSGNILYCTVHGPSRTAPAGALGKIYGNGNLRSLRAFSSHLLYHINEMIACNLITQRQMCFLVVVPPWNESSCTVRRWTSCRVRRGSWRRRKIPCLKVRSDYQDNRGCRRMISMALGERNADTWSHSSPLTPWSTIKI